MRVVITMAEFCLDCFNRMNGTHYKEKQVWLEEFVKVAPNGNPA